MMIGLFPGSQHLIDVKTSGIPLRNFKKLCKVENGKMNKSSLTVCYHCCHNQIKKVRRSLLYPLKDFFASVDVIIFLFASQVEFYVDTLKLIVFVPNFF